MALAESSTIPWQSSLNFEYKQAYLFLTFSYSVPNANTKVEMASHGFVE